MLKLLAPGAGFEQLTEAVTTEYGALLELVRQAVREKMRTTPGMSDWYPELCGIWPNRVVIKAAGRLWSHPYTVAADNKVTVADGVEVVATYANVREAAAAGHQVGVQVAMREAADGSIEVTIVRAGESINGNYYPDAVLRTAVPLFEGVRVISKSDAVHTAAGGKDVHNLLGGIYNARFVEGASPDSGSVVGTFRALLDTDPVVVKMTEAVRKGMTGLMGLSIDAICRIKRTKRGAKSLREATEFIKVNSVDLILEPGAGGGLDRLTEAAATTPSPDSTPGEIMLKKHLLSALAAVCVTAAAAMPADASGAQIITKLYESCAPLKLDPASVLQLVEAAAEADDVGPAVTRLVEAAKEKLAADQARLTEAAARGAQGEAPVTRAELAQRDVRIYAGSAIATSTLPQIAKDKLQAHFRGLERFTEAAVDAAIKGEREYLARFTESGRATGGMPRIEVGDRSEAMADMLAAFFDPKHKDHRNVRSIRECYIEMTGDRYVTGQVDRARLTESVGTDTFADVLGNSITRRMQQEYRDAVAWDAWSRVVNVSSVMDFRSQERVQMGGFGDLPIVAERGSYTSLTDPSDDKATYAVAKRGGLAQVTFEAIKNDDVSAIRRIPVELGRSAKRTLYTFVMNFFAANAAIYDAVALYHATHANLYTTALSAAQLSIHRLAMKKQTARDSGGKRMGIGPSMLLVPDDLEETAVDLFRRNTNNDKNFVQSLTLDIIPVSTWTDVNDWVTLANPLDIPVLEIGFLDGQQEPVLLTQDGPTEGSVFTNDVISYKTRHIYGGAILVDGFKGTTKAVVP